MSIPDWATTISGVIAVLAVVGIGIRVAMRHMISDYLSELKPNGGGSVKDKVNQIDRNLNKLEARVDSIYILLVQGKKD